MLSVGGDDVVMSNSCLMGAPNDILQQLLRVCWRPLVGYCGACMGSLGALLVVQHPPSASLHTPIAPQPQNTNRRPVLTPTTNPNRPPTAIRHPHAATARATAACARSWKLRGQFWCFSSCRGGWRRPARSSSWSRALLLLFTAARRGPWSKHRWVRQGGPGGWGARSEGGGCMLWGVGVGHGRVRV